MEPLLPPKSRVGRPRADNRTTINGILLALRAKTLRGYIAEGALIGIGVLARKLSRY